jgi:hypothetical protein
VKAALTTERLLSQKEAEQLPCSASMAGIETPAAHAGMPLQPSRRYPTVTFEIWNARTLELLRFRNRLRL